MQQAAAGQVSPDGHYYWNGAEWVSAASADGLWRWNGTGWEAMPSQPAGLLNSPPPALGSQASVTLTPFASPAPRALLVTISFGFLLLGYGIEIVGDGLALAGLSSPKADQFGPADIVLAISGLLDIAGFVATVVLFSMWVHRAYRNLPALGAAGLKYTPGWAVGWWFVPILNIWRPYLVMRDLWRHSAPMARSWTLLKVWWAMWLISNYLDNIVFRLTLQGQSNIVADMVSTFLDMVAAVLAVAVVRRITAWQLDRARIQPSLAPLS
jgi:hypothetical protein